MYHCVHCGKQHDGLPAFHADRPTPYWDVPEDNRDTDVFLTSDSCVIADRFFFVHGCIDLPIIGHDETFTWGVWVSLSEESFFKWQDSYEVLQRSHLGPFFGWLCTRLPLYPDTMHLKTSVHLRDKGIRPLIMLAEVDHPLYRQQQEGVTISEVLQWVHSLQDADNHD